MVTAGFELGSSAAGSDRSAKCATTTAQLSGNVKRVKYKEVFDAKSFHLSSSRIYSLTSLGKVPLYG